METTLDQYLTGWAEEAFRQAFPEADFSAVRLDVVATADEKFGDYQCNGAMALSKQLRMNPRQVAQAVLDALPLPEGVARSELAGPGFINFFLDDDWLAVQVERLPDDPRAGVPATRAPLTVIMDYGGPNIAKPMHIGHLRPCVIGTALDRIYRFAGHRVLADNHLGDWGTQFGLLILGYRNFLDQEALASRPVEELERLYVLSYNRSREDDTWRDQARAELVRLQQGDPENRKTWQLFVDLSLGAFHRVFDRLGVRFDLQRGESYYNDQLDEVIDRLAAAGIAVESEGALVVNLEEENLNVCIVRKSDGGFNYASTDIATVLDRDREFRPDRIVYVTDDRQQLHFRQVFSIARKLGVKIDLQHVGFGLMKMKDGVIKTREGNTIKLEALLDEAESRALAVVSENNPGLPEEQLREVARMIGVGAVKYADLSHNPSSVVTFEWDRALALVGNSGPYLQYACARISSVRDRYGQEFPAEDLSAFPVRLSDPVERRIAVRLLRFGSVVHQAAEQYRPNLVADYLYDLAQAYSTFYQNVPFLKAERGVRESRVRLCMAVQAVLRQGLTLLGMETPERI